MTTVRAGPPTTAPAPWYATYAHYPANPWIDPTVATLGYSLSTNARRSRRQLSFNAVGRRLRFLPLGLFWGLVAGGLNAYQVLWLTEPSPLYHGIELEEFVFLSIIGMVVTCPIATAFCGARLRREHSSTRWTLNWVITAFASSAAAIAIIFLMGSFSAILSLRPDVLFSHPTSDVEAVALAMLVSLFFSAGYGIFVGIECAAVALFLAPLSLLARRLILHRRPIAEPAGDASQPQP